MNRHFHICKRLAFLLTGVSALATLSACDLLGIKDPFESERPEQVLNPPNRRAPVLNKALEEKGPSPSLEVPNKPVSKADPKNDPFDYYNETETVKSDNSSPLVPMPTPAPVATPAPVPQPDQGNMFTRFIDSLGTQETPGEHLPRKPMPGNPHYSLDTEEAAPLAPAPQADIPSGKAFPDEAIVRWKGGDHAPTPLVPETVKPQAIAPEKAFHPVEEVYEPATPPVETIVQKPIEKIPESKPAEKSAEMFHPVETIEPVKTEIAKEPAADTGPAFPENAIVRWHEGDSIPAATKPVPSTQSNSSSTPVVLSTDGKEETKPAHKSSWSDRWLGEDKPQSELPPPEPNRYTPALSSVPPTPDEFKSVKSTKDQDLTNLQSDNAAAQEAKKSLDAEPSSQPHPSMPDMPPPKEKAPLLGGGAAPPPPFTALPPPAAPVTSDAKPASNSSWWDKVLSSPDKSGDNTNGNAGDSTSGSNLPSPDLLEQYKPRPANSQ